MKCNHCQAEWNAPKSQPTHCPFCNKPLVEERKTNNAKTPPEQVLAQMYRDEPEKFKNKNKLTSWLDDEFKPLLFDTKTLRPFKYATEFNVVTQLLEAKDFFENDKTIKIETLKSNLSDEYDMKAASASYVVDCFAFALLGLPVKPKAAYENCEKIEIITNNNFNEVTTNITLVRFKKNNKWGYKDKHTAKVVIPSQYDDAWDFKDGSAKVLLNNKEFYIDKFGNKV